MTDSTPSRSTARGLGEPALRAIYREMLTLLEEQAQLYRQLDALSERQAQLIEDDDADGLLGLLAERQGLVDRLEHGNRKLAPARQSWERRMEEVGPDEREHVRVVAAGIAEVAARVAARDDQDRRRMESRKTQITDEMLTLNKSRRAVASYATGAASAPRFQDRQG